MAAVVRLSRGFLTNKYFSTVFKQTVVNPVNIRQRLCFHTSQLLNVLGQEIKMPSLSPTMTAGTIVKWLKKEGDTIAPGDVLCEIQTDKAVMAFETEEEGILAKIMVPSGEGEVQVGTLIALMVAEGEDWKTAEVPSGGAGSGEASSPAPFSVAAAPSGGSVPGTSVMMPVLSPTMSEGKIVSWLKKEGEKLSPGDVLCEIQTDKAVMSMEVDDEGVLAKILVPAQTKAQVGQLIALVVAEGEDWTDVQIPAMGGAQAETPSVGSAPTPPSPTVGSPAPAVAHQLHGLFGPAVRALLEQYHLTGKEIEATGKNSRILKADVLKYITDKNLQPKPPVQVPLPGDSTSTSTSTSTSSSTSQPTVLGRKKTGYTDVEITSMRLTIAKRLTQSKSEIPHAYSTLQAEIDSLLTLRKQLKNVGVNISVNDFVVKAVARSLKQCPFVNKLYVNDQITSYNGVDISVAVATPNGLITPILKSADMKTVDQISEEIRELAGRAREGKLQLHQFQGGSFTISNLGMFGITEFSAIINPPQIAILAVGGGQPYVKLDGRAATVMSATLSYDARALSEGDVAAFMEVLQGYLENPASLLASDSASHVVKTKVSAEAYV
ncbi:dihydrolipoyllysine-residue acetyltransferase component of pyruvate dehydrogenase complex-like [Nilaparvata lugens]|uniref:dihydrolipoyllysine-residue acetyltransferase component of pyruvate dehydrogenase complex-like n=1 Tax=Nilaparvata lugens TaxID=108931 RepID=UPI00193E467B|nr:dihydrolipoyllysine-residue acetyltransferase component of pyruvate dehydrogenase complex-like [Nilaparvata lugens]